MPSWSEEVHCYHCDKIFFLNTMNLINAKTVSCLYCKKRINKKKSKIKLNIKEEIRDYIEMPKQELLELIKLDSERWYNLAKEHHDKWIKNKRCECCKDELIQSGKHVLTCKHWKDNLDNYLKDLLDTWHNKIKVLMAKNLKAGMDKATSFTGEKK